MTEVPVAGRQRSPSSPLLLAAMVVLSWAAEAALGEFTATVLHTNDVHGRFEQITPHGTRCTESSALEETCVGGIARQKTLVQQTINSGANVLFLNTGDYYQGSIWFYILGAEIVVDAVNYLKHDAMTLGNHEFDRGAPGLEPFLRGAKVPVLGCNVDFSEEPLLKDHVILPSLVVEKGGQKIGLIGYVTPNTTYLAKPGKVRFTDEVECIQREARKLRAKGVQIIIAMGHSGVPRDVEICQRVPEVSLVVGGHTHTFLYSGPTVDGKVSGDRPQGPYPTVVARPGASACLVVQDFYMGKYMGNITVTWDDHGDVVTWSGQPTLLDKTIPQDPAGLELLDKYRERVSKGRKMSVANTKVFLSGEKAVCRLGECNLGDLMADAFLKKMATFPSKVGSWSSVAAAICNAGGIRASIDEQTTGGVITFEDLVNVMPFSNTLILVNVTGSQLKSLFEFSVHRHDPSGAVGRGEFLAFAGIRVVFNVHNEPGNRVVDLQILCTECRVPKFERVQDDQVYRIVTVSYIFTGGDGYNFSFVKPNDQLNTGLDDAEVVIEYLNATSPITQGLDGRITFIGQPSATPATSPAPSTSLPSPSSLPRSGAGRFLDPTMTTVLLCLLFSVTAVPPVRRRGLVV